MKRRRSLAAAVLPGLLLLVPVPGVAQTVAPERRAEIDVGIVWTGAGSFGSRDANLTTPGGGNLALFSTSSRLTPGFGPEAHIAFRVSKRLRAELTGAWSRTKFETRVTSDFEGASAVTTTLPVSVFSVEGSAVWYFGRRGRLEPFARGGAGWMRELTSDSILTANGVIANAGAGMKYWWHERSRGRFRRLGLRAEARLVTRSGGLSLGAGTRVAGPAMSISAILGF